MTNTTTTTEAKMTTTQDWTHATKHAVEALQVGDEIAMTFDTAWGKALPGARYGDFHRITEIRYRGTSVKGNAYAGVTVESGTGNGWMSFSIGEDDGERFKIRKAVR